MIKITLEDENGKGKTYTQSKKTTRKLRSALKLMSQYENVDPESTKISDHLKEIDEIMAFIIDVFDNQFTFDELQDGTYGDEIEDIGIDIITQLQAGDDEDKKKNRVSGLNS